MKYLLGSSSFSLQNVTAHKVKPTVKRSPPKPSRKIWHSPVQANNPKTPYLYIARTACVACLVVYASKGNPFSGDDAFIYPFEGFINSDEGKSFIKKYRIEGIYKRRAQLDDGDTEALNKTAAKDGKQYPQKV